ncbi:MAG TPA: trypsin-like peptidase domain-containing protein [Terriglobales bacterium]|nr:trypsin-like peptidase domain-containing protein [Terriglobales bacterium]
MKMWVQDLKTKFSRQNLKHVLTTRVGVAVLAVAVAASMATFSLTKSARAATPAPAASALDDNSVSALLSLDHAMETLAARVTPAVVNVTVVSKQKAGAEDDGTPDLQQFFGPGGPFGQFGPQFGQPGRQFHFQQQPQNRVERGLGSGVIISPDGYIVTNNHVVEGAVDIRVTMSNKEVMPAKLIGADPLTDLAVIKVSGSNLPSIPWGNSENLHPGQTVLAFGNPFGLQFTVTRGIISALNRPNPDSDRRKPGEFIQTDAAINPGNSGGALVNARGELIGINTFLISASGNFAGTGFAIPTQIVEPTVNTLIKDGKVEHGYIGIQIADVTPDNAKFFNLNKAVGALVSDVTAGAPGSKAGLKTGDVITELDGRTITDAGQLQMLVGQHKPGDTIHLTVMREDKPTAVAVTLGDLNNPNTTEVAGNREHKGRWGLSLGDLDQNSRQELAQDGGGQIPNIHGAIVNDVVPGSPADNAGISRGDIIMEVNRKPMKSASDVAQALGSVSKGQDALVLVWSNGGSTFRVLHPSEG